MAVRYWGIGAARPCFTSPKVGVVSKSINRCWTTFHNGQEQLRRSCRPSHLEMRQQAADPSKNTAPLSPKSSNFGFRVQAAGAISGGFRRTRHAPHQVLARTRLPTQVRRRGGFPDDSPHSAQPNRRYDARALQSLKTRTRSTLDRAPPSQFGKFSEAQSVFEPERITWPGSRTPAGRRRGG